MSQLLPQLCARVYIFSQEEGGPELGFFSFPQTGIRPVSVEINGVCGLNTVGFFYTPNALIHADEQFEAGARVLWEEGFAPATRRGATFRIWDGRFIAAGEVLDVHPEQ